MNKKFVLACLVTCISLPANAGFFEKVLGVGLGDIRYVIVVGSEPDRVVNAVYSLQAQITNNSDKILNEVWFECVILNANGGVAIDKRYFMFQAKNILPKRSEIVYLRNNVLQPHLGSGYNFTPLQGYKANCRLYDAKFSEFGNLYK